MKFQNTGDKWKILKLEEKEEKKVTHTKRSRARMALNLSTTTMEIRRQGSNFKILKENNFHPRILYPRQTIHQVGRLNTDVFGHARSKKWTSQTPFLERLLRDVPHQNKRYKQERGRDGLIEPKDLTQR